MYMRFGACNVGSMYRASSLRAVAGEILDMLDLVGVQRSDGTEVAPNQQANIRFSMERGMIITN
jgi:hypothetical protein